MFAAFPTLGLVVELFFDTLLESTCLFIMNNLFSKRPNPEFEVAESTMLEKIAVDNLIGFFLASLICSSL